MDKRQNIVKYHKKDRSPPQPGYSSVPVISISNRKTIYSQIRTQANSELNNLIKKINSKKLDDIEFIMPYQGGKTENQKTWWDAGDSKKTKVY
jgi:hypothetical protein